jgi:predicted ATPase
LNLTERILKRLFETLINKGAVIFATSNRPPDDLYYNGINRDSFLPFIDFIKKKNDIVNIDSANDYRLSGKKVKTNFIQ